MIGTTIQQYNILEKIGQGGMGVVYKAFDIRLQRTVALKFLPENFAASETDKARFLREARAASAINHPNVCTIYDLKEHDGAQFIVMEYIEGETLKDIIKSGRLLPVDKVVDYIKQVAEALRAAHDKGIIHRDIKSENIMLTSSGKIKVMDFGLARIKGATELTKSASTVGTVAYMSPEQLDGQKVDIRADIFSFGVVFYELLTTHLPFKGETPSAMIHSILNKEPQPVDQYVKNVPLHLVNVMHRTLAKDVKQRYVNMQHVLDDLNRVEKSQRRAFTKFRKRKWKKQISKRTFAYTITILIVLVLAGFLLRFIKATAEKPFQIIPVTSGGGKAERAQFSPNGRQIVYDYLKDKETNSDIYIQQLGTNQVLQLTSHTTDDKWPAWSPDGKFIAFCRSSDDSEIQGIYLISSLGGMEKKLNSKNCQHLCWSPDGRTLAFSDFGTSAIFLLDVESRQERQLTYPHVVNSGFLIDRSASFSPDGKQLAFARSESFATCSIYIIPTRGGQPKRITFDNDQIYGLTWSPRNRIIYSSNRAVGYKLWSIKPNGKFLKPIAASGRSSYYPALSADGKRLLYTEFYGGEHDIGRIKIPAQTAVTPQEIIAIPGYDCWPDISPDGKHLTFVSMRTGHSEVWKSDMNGKKMQQISTLENYNGRPRWSPDGRRIVFDSRPYGNSDIFVIPAEGGLAKQLTSDSTDDVLPNWSRDGEWIYYCRRSENDYQIYKVPSDSGSPQQITTNGGLMALAGMEGKFIYVQKYDEPEIWRYHLDGSQESLVFRHGNDYRLWGLDKGGLYYFTHSIEDSLWHLNTFRFSDKTISTVATIKDIYNISGPVLSPDGHSLYFHFIKQKMQSDIFLVENFE
ncbi:serine/threonine-protein kinase [candidate division KSB1 bacterium]|nr:PD40 domain-containing protein [candidate division KSB1 bacterium]RQW05034.1 MAG: serine/threonine-protein kinase [candidate division KSB1 bacterium]